MFGFCFFVFLSGGAQGTLHTAEINEGPGSLGRLVSGPPVKPAAQTDAEAHQWAKSSPVWPEVINTWHAGSQKLFHPHSPPAASSSCSASGHPRVTRAEDSKSQWDLCTSLALLLMISVGLSKGQSMLPNSKLSGKAAKADITFVWVISWMFALCFSLKNEAGQYWK